MRYVGDIILKPKYLDALFIQKQKAFHLNTLSRILVKIGGTFAGDQANILKYFCFESLYSFLFNFKDCFESLLHRLHENFTILFSINKTYVSFQKIRMRNHRIVANVVGQTKKGRYNLQELQQRDIWNIWGQNLKNELKVEIEPDETLQHGTIDDLKIITMQGMNFLSKWCHRELIRQIIIALRYRCKTSNAINGSLGICFFVNEVMGFKSLNDNLGQKSKQKKIEGLNKKKLSQLHMDPIVGL